MSVSHRIKKLHQGTKIKHVGRPAPFPLWTASVIGEARWRASAIGEARLDGQRLSHSAPLAPLLSARREQRESSHRKSE